MGGGTGDKIEKTGKRVGIEAELWLEPRCTVAIVLDRKLSQSYRMLQRSSLESKQCYWSQDSVVPTHSKEQPSTPTPREMILDSWLNMVCLRKMERLRCPISYLRKLLKINNVYSAVCCAWLSNKPDLFKVWEKEKKTLQLLDEWFYWKCQHSIMRFILKVKDSGGEKKRILFRNTECSAVTQTLHNLHVWMPESK